MPVPAPARDAVVLGIRNVILRGSPAHEPPEQRPCVKKPSGTFPLRPASDGKRVVQAAENSLSIGPDAFGRIRATTVNPVNSI